MGHAVVGTAPGDDLVAPREPAHGLGLAGDLDRRFHGLGAARDKKDARQIAGCDIGEFAGKADRLIVAEGRRGRIGDTSGLFGHDIANLPPAVAGVDDEKSGETVKIGPAAHVPER